MKMNKYKPATMLDALFIQPTYACRLNCRGCYVKRADYREQQLISTLFDAVREFTNKVPVRQVTLAVDDLPDNVFQAQNMIQALKLFNRSYLELPTYTELHITANSAKSFVEYIDRDAELREARQTPVDVLSLSHLTPEMANALKSNFKTYENSAKLNYNFMPHGQGLEQYKQILPFVDFSYLVLFKPEFGSPVPYQTVRSYHKCLREISTWPAELREKIIVDHCVQTALPTSKLKTCGANSKKLHLWPDGRVTGCPYNSNGGVLPDTTVDSIVNNLYNTMQEDEFGECLLPSSYQSNKKSRSRFRVLR